MAAFWRFVSSLRRKPTSAEHEVAVDPLEHRSVTRVSKRRFRGRFPRRRLARSFANDAGKKTPQAVPEDLDDEQEVERHHEVVHEVSLLRQAIDTKFCIDDEFEVRELCAEANALIHELDERYGWEPGEPLMADRMFHTDVRQVISDAMKTNHADIRLLALVRAMRAVRHGPNAGTKAIAKAVAARNLIGGPSKSEAELLFLQRRLRWDHYAELAGIADALSLSRERAISHRLQTASPMTTRDLSDEFLAHRSMKPRSEMQHSDLARDIDRGSP